MQYHFYPFVIPWGKLRPWLWVPKNFSPFGVGCIFGFTAILGGASTLIVDKSYLTRNIRFHFWNCVGLFGTGLFMILFCNYPLIECYLRTGLFWKFDDFWIGSKTFKRHKVLCKTWRVEAFLQICLFELFYRSQRLRSKVVLLKRKSCFLTRFELILQL